MKSDDIEDEVAETKEYPTDCARGLRNYLFVMAVVVIGTLAGVFWFRQSAPAATTMIMAGQPMVPAPGVAPVQSPPLVQTPPMAQVVAMPVAARGAPLDFATIVTNLRGSVVSVGRSRPENRFGLGRNAPVAIEPAPQPGVTPAPDGQFQFATPTATAVLESIGTGFVVRTDGYILTNYHVVRGNDSMVVTVFDEVGAERYPATIVKLDASVDLALLKIEPRAPLVVAPLGDSDQVQVADEVIAIGSPFGLDLTVSRGIVSAKRKSLVIEGTLHRDLLQTDAAINQGNSGGPLVNRYGEVIGIDTAIYTPTGAFAGIGFAVPSNQAKQFLAEELNTLPGTGWTVAVAQPGIPAGAAGPPILAGAPSPHRDGRGTMACTICHQIIPHPGTVQSVTVAAPALGAPPPISVGAVAPHRDGRETMPCVTCHTYLPNTAKVAPVAQLGAPGGELRFARPPTTLALNVGTVPTAPTGENFGIQGATTLPMTAALAGQTGQPEGKGVFVAAVSPGSPAANAGLSAGAIIEKVNGRRIHTPRDLLAMVEAGKVGDSLRLLVTQNGSRQELSLVIASTPVPPPVPTPPTLAPSGLPPGPPATVPTEFNWRGMEIETFSTLSAPNTAGTVKLKGANVAEVVPGSPAARVGVQANDIILEINGQPTGTAIQMNQAIQAVTGKRDVVMKMARTNREFFVVLP